MTTTTNRITLLLQFYGSGMALNGRFNEGEINDMGKRNMSDVR